VTCGLIAALLVIVVIALCALGRFTIVRVVGESMAPTLVTGQRLVAYKRRCHVNDIVVFRADYGAADLRYLVKRVAAVGGDPVPTDLRASVDVDIVPAGTILVRGDGGLSIDSNRLGLIAVNNIRGVVLDASGRPQGHDIV